MRIKTYCIKVSEMVALQRHSLAGRSRRHGRFLFPRADRVCFLEEAWGTAHGK